MTSEHDDKIQNSFFSMVTGQDEGDAVKEVTSDKHLSGNEINPAQHATQPVSTETALNEVTSTDNTTHTEETGMPHDARRVLVHLMRQGVIIASQKPKLFESMCRYEALIRRHLADVYLQLVLDSKTGVAFVAAASSEHCQQEQLSSELNDDADEESTSLITKRALSLYDTLILLVLRKYYQERESTGEQKIIIDLDRLESFLIPFMPLTDHASKDRKKLLARLKEMTKRKILTTIRGADDRYEITPIIRYVVSASFLESMLAEYTQLAADQCGDPIKNTSQSETSS